MAHLVSPRAQLYLDEIWLYIAKESASLPAADRVIHPLTRRFVLLANYPFLGRTRDEDFGVGMRSLVVDEYVIVYMCHGSDVLILRVLHGRRDLEALFGN